MILFIASVEVYHYLRDHSLLENIVDGVISVAVAVLLIEVAYRAILNLQQQLQQEVIERTRAEEQLKEVEQEQSLILNSISDHVIFQDTQQKIIRANKAAADSVGLTPEELKGRYCYEIWHQRDEPCQDCPIVKTVEAGEPKEGEITSPDGRVWFIRGFPVRDAKGSLSGVIEVTTELTERLKAEKLLRQREERFRSLVEHSRNGMFILDDAFRFVYVNDELCRMIDRSYQEIVGREFDEFFEKEGSLLSLREGLLAQGEEETPVHIEAFLVRGNGERRHVEISPSLIKDSAGKRRVVAQVIDVTERRKSEEDLKRHLEIEKSLVEVSSELVKATQVDKAVERALALLGKSFEADRVVLFYIKESEEVWDLIYEWRREGVTTKRKRMKGLQPDQPSWWEKATKSTQPVVVSGAAQKENSLGEVGSYVAIPILYESELKGIIGLTTAKEPRDWLEKEVDLIRAAGEIIITSLAKDSFRKKLAGTLKELAKDRRRMEELTKGIIEAQEKERRYLASEIHDDLLQGLVATLFFLRSIDVSKLGKELQQRKKRLETIISESVDRGRLLMREIEPIREPEIGLVQAVKRSIDLNFANTKTQVQFEFPERLPWLDISHTTNLLRIIQEALMNIRKHAQATEVFVRIKVSDDKRELIVEVGDNGVGFDAEEVSSKTVGQFGLLSMKERARISGGRLSVESKPGQGTVIKGVFPLEVEDRKKKQAKE